MRARVPAVILYLEVDLEKQRPSSEGGRGKIKGTCTSDGDVDVTCTLNCLSWDFFYIIESLLLECFHYLFTNTASSVTFSV